MDDLLNSALIAYIRTIPNARQLETYLELNHLLSRRAEIEGKLRSVVGDADVFLFAQETKVMWTDAFKESFFQHLRANHPWLTREGFDRLVSYGGWLCWHEGL